MTVVTGVSNSEQGHLAFRADMTQKQSPKVFCKIGIFRNFTKFTEKHLCQGLSFNKVSGLQNTCLTEDLWTTTSDDCK